MLDDRVRAVLTRLEAEDARERAKGVPREQRARAIPPTTGRFLFALVAPNAGCEVLEIGGSRGYSTIWLEPGAVVVADNILSHPDSPRRTRRRGRPIRSSRASPCRSTAGWSSRPCSPDGACDNRSGS